MRYVCYLYKLDKLKAKLIFPVWRCEWSLAPNRFDNLKLYLSFSICNANS